MNDVESLTLRELANEHRGPRPMRFFHHAIYWHVHGVWGPHQTQTGREVADKIGGGCSGTMAPRHCRRNSRRARVLIGPRSEPDSPELSTHAYAGTRRRLAHSKADHEAGRSHPATITAVAFRSVSAAPTPKDRSIARLPRCNPAVCRRCIRKATSSQGTRQDRRWLCVSRANNTTNSPSECADSALKAERDREEECYGRGRSRSTVHLIAALRLPALESVLKDLRREESRGGQRVRSPRRRA